MNVFVYYYLSENSVGSQFDSPNLATHIAFVQNGFKAIATFFQYLFQFFFMNFYSICGNQDLGQSDSKNSIVALFMPTLLHTSYYIIILVTAVTIMMRLVIVFSRISQNEVTNRDRQLIVEGT